MRKIQDVAETLRRARHGHVTVLIDEPGNAPVTLRNAGDTVGGPCARLISRKQRADNYFW
jgi:hypothetical protein